MVLEKTLESLLDYTEIHSVHPKGTQSWVFIGRTDVEAETPILSHLMRRADSFEKTLMLGKIEGRRRRGRQRMRRLNGITDSMDMSLGVSDGQGGLVCCSSWDWKELNITEWLNWTGITLKHAHLAYLSTGLPHLSPLDVSNSLLSGLPVSALIWETALTPPSNQNHSLKI